MKFKNNLIKKLAKLTRKKRLYRLDPFLRKIYNPDKRREDFMDMILQLEEGYFICVNTSSFLEWSIFFYGSYEPMISRLIKSVLRPGDVAIDVGANVGLHSLTMANTVGRVGKIYCFEPHPKIMERLVENISLNRMDWVVPIEAGLCQSVGTAVLYGFDGSDGNQGVSTLEKNVLPHNENRPKFEINTWSLNEFVKKENITKLDLIKIDVEGKELDVLYGGDTVIKEFRPQIVFEYNGGWDTDKKNLSRVLEFFRLLNYKLYVVQHKDFVPISYANTENANLNLLAVPLINLDSSDKICLERLSPKLKGNVA